MYTLITNNNIDEYSQDVKEAEGLYYHNEGDIVEKAIMDGSVTYIVFKENGCIGGAKITVPDQQHIINRYFADNGYQVNEFCVLEDVYFHVPSESLLNNDLEQFEAVCQRFYKGLYEMLKLTCLQQNKNGLITLNPYEEHEDIMYFGQWPFISQHITPNDQVLGLILLQDFPEAVSPLCLAC